MLRLTNLADYAVVMMTSAAREPGVKLSSSSAAALTGIPFPTASKLMNMLARAGLLCSTRGIAGGFRLRRPAEEITLADIVEAVEGPITLTACLGAAGCDCAIESKCRMRAHWPGLNQLVRSVFRAVTLADLARDEPLAVLNALGRHGMGGPLASPSDGAAPLAAVRDRIVA